MSLLSLISLIRKIIFVTIVSQKLLVTTLVLTFININYLFNLKIRLCDGDRKLMKFFIPNTISPLLFNLPIVDL